MKMLLFIPACSKMHIRSRRCYRKLLQNLPLCLWNQCHDFFRRNVLLSCQKMLQLKESANFGEPSSLNDSLIHAFKDGSSKLSDVDTDEDMQKRADQTVLLFQKWC